MINSLPPQHMLFPCLFRRKNKNSLGLTISWLLSLLVRSLDAPRTSTINCMNILQIPIKTCRISIRILSSTRGKELWQNVHCIPVEMISVKALRERNLTIKMRIKMLASRRSNMDKLLICTTFSTAMPVELKQLYLTSGVLNFTDIVSCSVSIEFDKLSCKCFKTRADS